MFPDHLKYCKTHQWLKVDGNQAILGVTDHAQNELGDVVFIELPQVGSQVEPETPFGVIESVKAVSDLFCPVTGEVIKINDAVIDSPEIVNREPYENGWLLVIEMSDPGELAALMTSSQYEEFVGS